MELMSAIRDRIPIETVVGESVALRRRGEGYEASCPFCRVPQPTFAVSSQQGRYHCLACGADGDIFTFVMATHNLDFPDALHFLAARLT